MLNCLRLLVVVGLLTGCATVEKPTGEWVWTHPELYAQAAAGEISEAELNHKFVISKSKCKIESLKIPVPSPSCTQPPRQDCTGKTGFALVFCQSYTPPQRCDYSAVNAAKNAQIEVLNSCMQLAGWNRVWQPYQESEPVASRQESSESADNDSVQEAIDSIPELALWQKSDPGKWNLAASIDERLRESPKYKEMPLRERFLVVVEKVKQVEH